MKEKKEIKINLEVAIIIITIIALLVVAIMYKYFIQMKTQNTNVPVPENNVQVSESVANDSEEKKETSADTSKESEVKQESSTDTHKNSEEKKEETVETSKDSQENVKEETINNTENQANKNILGEWKYVSAYENEKEVSFREIFGSSIEYGMGSLTLREDGTFTNYFPGATSSEFEDSGNFTVNENKINLNYTQETDILTYNASTETIEQTYGNYILTLTKKR